MSIQVVSEAVGDVHDGMVAETGVVVVLLGSATPMCSRAINYFGVMH